MKKHIKTTLLLLLSLILALSFVLTSCGEKTAPEENGDTENGDTEVKPNPDQNKPDDNTKPDVKPEDDGKLHLTENGKANFKFVLNFGMVSPTLRNEVRTIQKTLEKAGIEVELASSEDAKLVSDCEILIGGSISHREGSVIDTIPLGNEGYEIRITGNRVAINGGTDASTLEALNIFFKDKLKIKDSKTDLKNLSIERDYSVISKQEYMVTSISVGGVNLSEFKISVDEKDVYAVSAASMLKDRIYAISGYWLPIVDIDCTDEHLIRIRNTDDCGSEGYRVRVLDGNLNIDCLYTLLIEETTEAFMAKHLSLVAEGDIKFDNNFIYEKQIRNLTYCEYGGAVGDGKADDYAAIKKTHDRANLTGQTVIADPGKTFNLGQHDSPIYIKTDTIWREATLIFDDRPITADSPEHRSQVFSIVSDYTKYNVNGIEELKPNQANIGVKLKTKSLLYIENSNEKQYIRYGGNANDGAAMHEIILVDENGNVDPSTPIMWHYKTVTSCVAYPCIDKPITIIGGKVKTYANIDPKMSYYARGISINRSNVTLKGFDHTVEYSSETSAPYYGLFDVSKCNNTLIEDCKISGRIKYSNGPGTYELTGSNANNITWRNITQYQDINDRKYWGVMGTNYCKNLTYDSCVLSRFDAHAGVWNATIKNSKLGHQKINAIGGGKLLVENTLIYGDYIVNFRSDYGSTWKGDLVVRNITLANSGQPYIVSGSWANHYFGYQCFLPETITVENLRFTRGEDKYSVYFIQQFAKNGLTIDKSTVGGKPNLNPFVLTREVIITANPHNYNFKVSPNSQLFGRVKITGK